MGLRQRGALPLTLDQTRRRRRDSELPVPFGPRTFVSTRFLPHGVLEEGCSEKAPLLRGHSNPSSSAGEMGMGRAARRDREGPSVSCQRRSFFRARFRRRGCRDHARSSAPPICGRSADKSPCSPSLQGFRRSRRGPISQRARHRRAADRAAGSRRTAPRRSFRGRR